MKSKYFEHLDEKRDVVVTRSLWTVEKSNGKFLITIDRTKVYLSCWSSVSDFLTSNGFA